DQGEVIVCSASLVTGNTPPTNITMGRWLRVSGWIGACRQRLTEGALSLAKECRVIGEAVPLRLEIRPWRDNVHELGRDPLRDSKQVAVQAKLEDRASFGLAGQLGVQRFIRPGAQGARHFYPAQNVRPPNPAAMREGALDNDRRAGLHGRQ